MRLKKNQLQLVHPLFLVILFGTLEYDGRAKRMIEVLTGLGGVILVDLLPKDGIQGCMEMGNHLTRIRIPVSKAMDKYSRHLRLWYETIIAACRFRPDLVVAANFFTVFPGSIGAKAARASFVYDAYELIIPQVGTAISKRAKFWYLLERLTVKDADLVIAANTDRARLMAEHYNLSHSPTVMRNIPPIPAKPQRVPPPTVEFSTLVRRTTDECLVLYQGDVTFDRGIQRFVDALAFLPSHFRFVIAGGGPDLEHLRHTANDYQNQGRFTTLGRIPYTKLAEITRMADIGIVTYPFSGLNNIYCAPNKVFEYAQAGVPIVTTDQPPLKRIIEEYSIGALVRRQDSPQEIAEILQSVACQGKSHWIPALESFLENHRWEDESARLRKELQAILPKKGLL